MQHQGIPADQRSRPEQSRHLTRALLLTMTTEVSINDDNSSLMVHRFGYLTKSNHLNAELIYQAPPTECAVWLEICDKPLTYQGMSTSVAVSACIVLTINDNYYQFTSSCIE